MPESFKLTPLDEPTFHLTPLDEPANEPSFQLTPLDKSWTERIAEKMTKAMPVQPISLQGGEDTGFVSNALRLAGERVTDLAGSAVRGVSRPAEALNDQLGLGRFVWGDGKGLRYVSAEEFQRMRYPRIDDPTAPEPRNVLTETVPEALRSVDLGGEERHTPEQIKEAFRRGDISNTLSATLKFGAETGIKSIPDMAFALTNLPGYVVARSDEIATERARNKGLPDATVLEQAEALPFALAASLLERIGAKGITQAGAEQIGKEAIASGMRRVAAEGGKAGAKEAGTEAFQEGVIEYVGEKFGTDAAMSIAEAGERGFFGAIGGAVPGTVGGTAVAAGREIARPSDTSPERRAPSGTDAAQPDGVSVDDVRLIAQDRLTELENIDAPDSAQLEELEFLREFSNDPEVLAEALGVTLAAPEFTLTPVDEVEATTTEPQEFAETEKKGDAAVASEASDFTLTPVDEGGIEVEELTPDQLTPEQRQAFDQVDRQRDEATAEAELDTQLEQQAAAEGRQQATERGMDVAVNAMLAGTKNAPKVEFVNGISGVPASLRKRVRKSKGTRTEGLYDPATNRVFILTDAVTTPERAAWVAAHEIAGHRGLHGIFDTRQGKQALDNELTRTRQNTTIRALADAIRKQRSALTETRSTEEAISELSAAVRTGNFGEIESRYGVTVPEAARNGLRAMIERFIQRVKKLLGRGDAYTDADVRKLIEDSWRYVREGETTQTQPAAEDVEVVASEVPNKPARKFTPPKKAKPDGRPKIPEGTPRGLDTPGWNFDEGRWEGRKGARRRARAELQDKMLSWRDAQENIAEALGETIPDADNVYRLENLMHGRVKEGLDKLEESQIEPLARAIAESGIDVATIEEYLYARHARERNAQIAKINPKMPDGGSGMTNAEAGAILERLKPQRAKLAFLAAKVDRIVRATRNRLLAKGLITKEQFDAMESQYQHFVPLRGKQSRENDLEQNQGGAGRGLDTRAKPVRQALGRGAGNKAENILAEIIGDAQRSIILAEKARVGRAVKRLVLANPNPKLWEVEPVQTERRLDVNGEVYEAVVQDWSDPSIIAVRENGKLYKVQINHAQLAKALNHIGVEHMGLVLRAAGALNRYFSAILTRYNPAFIPVNMVRDIGLGLTGLAVEHGEIVALRVAAYYPIAARAAWRQARRKPAKSKADKYAQEFAEDGGKTGYVHMLSTEDLQRQIGKGRLGKYSRSQALRAARGVVDVVGAINDAVENSIRLSTYVTLRERGMSREAAAEYAKNMTVNFNRKGFSGSKINALFLFYNAAIQGAKRVGDLMRKPKTWAYLGSLAAIQVAATMYAMGVEDEDGEPIWNKVPDYVKRHNLVFTWLDDEGEQQLLTIPMAYGINLFVWLAGRTSSALMQNEDRPQDSAANIAAETISTAAYSFSPFPIDDGAIGFVPTALRIPLSVQANRDDFGYQIRRENPFGKFDVPRSAIGRPDTIEIFKVAATGLNRIGGGDDYTPPPMSAFDWAPEDIEYVLERFTGGIGRFVVDTATLGQKAGGDDPVTATDIPITKRFFSVVDDEAAQQSKFYDRRDTIERDAARVRDIFENDGEAAAREFLKNTPSLSGADFVRYKRGNPDEGKAPGDIILYEGRPRLTAKTGSVYALYKAASGVVSEQNEAIRSAYTGAPSSLIPDRERDRAILEHAKTRAEAQRAFNKAWNRDVVGGK